MGLYVIDPVLWDSANAGRRSQLAAHLRALDDQLVGLGGKLRVEVGDPISVLPRSMQELGATVVHVNADTTPYSRRRDHQVHHQLGDRLAAHWGTLVHSPGTILTRKGTLSQVFAPFHRRWIETDWSTWPAPGTARVLDAGAGAGVPFTEGPPAHPGGEDAAFEQVTDWLQRVDHYPDTHDLPAIDGTSRLSQDLRWGTISPRSIATVVGTANPARQAFVRQLAWRDWYAHLLWSRPEMVDQPLRPGDELIEWRDDDDGFAAWRDGRTGYPIVDAGMRQLASSGWMHNRVRMIAASFLVKDLLIDWRRGERYFRHVLVDGDVAQNVGNWQWVAGTGPDAAPYFRIFNPITQSRKFDADGTYIRRWVPELAGVPAKWIHAPWEAPPLDLLAASCTIGVDYPAPIVDHRAARERTLDAYATARAIPPEPG